MDLFIGLIAVALRPRTKGDRERLERGLEKLDAEGPPFRTQSAPDTGDFVLLAMGDQQLEILIDRLRRDFHVEGTTSKPWVVPRSGLTGAADGEGRYAEHARGRGHYAHVKIRIRPGSPGTGLTFVDETLEVAIPKRFVGPIEDSIRTPYRERRGRCRCLAMFGWNSTTARSTRSIRRWERSGSRRGWR